MAVIVCDIKFLRCRTEPVQHIGIIFQYPCKQQFRVAVKLGPVKYALFDAIKEDRLDFFRISRKKADTLNIVVVLFQIVVSGTAYFLLQESVLTVEVLKHLLVDFVADVTLVHHYNILHTIDAVAVCIVVTDLRDQLEQQSGAFFIVDFRLFTKLFQNDLLRIISFKIDGLALDTLPILHILQVLHEEFIFDRHMGEFCHIEVKIQEHIILNTCIGNFDARDRNKLTHSSTMGFFGLIEHPCSQRIFILLEHLAQVSVLGNLLLDRFHDLLCLCRCDSMARCVLNMLRHLGADDFSRLF